MTMRSVALLLCFLAGPMVCYEGWCAPAEPRDAADDTTEKAKWSPLVTVKQATIRGRVLILSADSDAAQPGSGVKIEVLTGTARQSVVSTTTDEEGRFSLPNLDVGVYRLKAGRLTLKLRVDEAQEASTTARRLPKTLLLYMPEEMKK